MKQIAFDICSECKKNNIIQPLQIDNKGQATCPIHEVYFNNILPSMVIEYKNDRNHC